jgi:hypothetical protein
VKGTCKGAECEENVQGCWHRLFRSHRTGNIIKSDFLRFVFPARWHYDIVRALDHFRAVGAPRNVRITEAIDIVRGRRRNDGRWSLDYTYKDGGATGEAEPSLRQTTSTASSEWSG